MEVFESIKNFPKYVEIVRFSLKIYTNKSSLDLQQIYDNTKTSYESIQMVNYNNKTKYADKLTKNNERLVKRDQVGRFLNCCTFYFDKHKIKLYKTGNMTMSFGRFDEKDASRIVQTIMDQIGETAKNIYTFFQNVIFIIRIKHIDITVMSQDSKISPSGTSYGLSFKEDLRFKILDNAIHGFTHSMELFKEFVEFIKEFTTFIVIPCDNFDENILLNDEFSIEVTI